LKLKLFNSYGAEAAEGPLSFPIRSLRRFAAPADTETDEEEEDDDEAPVVDGNLLVTY